MPPWLTGSDTRQALRAVREQLGEEAVILTSKRTGEGVEVMGSRDMSCTVTCRRSARGCRH